MIVIFVSGQSSSSSSCKKRAELCRSGGDCCPVPARRMVCAAHLELCGKNKICCITEVEEQQEKQAALIRNRNEKLKRFFNLFLNEDDDY